MMRRIALFGGSFDPVHLGHLLVARAAFEELGLDRVVFIPAWQSPFKPGTTPAPPKARLAMLRSALAGQSWCHVDEQEIARGGISYTIETARAYREAFPGTELFYLVGADHVPQLPKWRDSGELASILHFVVVPRPGQVETPLPAPLKGSWLRGFPLGVSSSTVRERVKNGLPIDHLVPATAAEIIRNNGLYL